MSDLLNNCQHIANTIETGVYDDPSDEEQGCNAYDYLESALDIEYIVSSTSEYLGARILVSFGGPNIWINTRTKTVEGAWWGESCNVHYHRDELGLDDALEEIWNCR